MREKFDKYWSEYSIVLAFGAILDPTKKLNFLTFAYQKIDLLEAKEKLENVKNKLSRLYEEYVKNGSHSSNEFEEYESQTINVAGTSDLDDYLAEQRLPPICGFDILAFWKERSRRCHDLAKMACDILSIPITTVASESTFSIGARVLNKYRSSLKDDTVQALMCSRSWLHGFVEYDSDNDEDGDKKEVISSEGPNQ
ncbi:zinc finger BED domain-containing protein DAYSLEEPER-like [Vicia villosa]|uniref:zinc finger BED domain-containing protein DAYSLEEPER-like n=1 Tax=Vicia villosa TaxID=3911 RepID=UPI00273B9769|nr:zinc finger BED domain-containing protein DAYSLEEPER-like [Vicia villosa]